MAEGQGRSEGQGLKLLYLRDYFYKETGQNHQKDIEQIIAFLDRKNVRVSDKTLYSDFRLLRDKLDVPIKYDGRTRKYYVAEPQYSGQELALLIDCVCQASFVTEKDARRLMEIIKGLANVADRSMIADRISEYEDRRQTKASVIDNIPLLTQAIEQGRKIMFQEVKYVAEHSTHAEIQPEFIIASPLNLCQESGKTVLEYLIELDDMPESIKASNISCLEKYPSLQDLLLLNASQRFCDVSMMANVKILDEPSISAAYLKELEGSDWETNTTVIDDLSPSERAVTIRFCKNELEKVVQDLGNDAILIDEDAAHFKVTIRHELSEGFYKWIFGFLGAAKILAPDEAVNGYKEWYRRSMLKQEALYAYDVEPMMLSFLNPDTRTEEEQIKAMYLSGCFEASKWRIDCQQLRGDIEDTSVELSLPDFTEELAMYDGLFGANLDEL